MALINQKLNYQVLGEGQPIVLIHGLFGSLENLNMVAKPLSLNYQAISVDVRNHGNSFHSNEMNYTNMAEDIFNLMDVLNINSTAILGHSMGGKIAMQCALIDENRINKLIVADITPAAYEPHHNAIIEGLRAVNIKYLENRKQADTQLEEYVEEVSTRQFLLRNLVKSEQGFQWRCDLDSIATNYNNIAKGIENNGIYNKNTLFIKGENSNYIQQNHRKLINSIFPKATAKIINGAGHWLHAEKTTAFNKIVTTFLQE